MTDMVRLSLIEKPGRYLIVDIDGTNPSLKDRLLCMGFLPGREVELVQRISRKGARIVRLGRSDFVLDVDISEALIIGDLL